MPVNGMYGVPPSWKVLAEAKRQVRAKFPDIVEGSSGWYRALTNRLKRIRRV